MKTAKFHLTKFFVAAAMLLLAHQSHALTTPYMVGLSNQLSGYYSLLTNSPAPEHKKEARALAVALRDLKRPTTTVAQDYDRFFLAVLHLGTYAFTDTNLAVAGDLVAASFIGDAVAKVQNLSVRTNFLNQFVVTRKAAMQNINEAYALIVANISETNKQTALLRGRRIFSKLTTAEKLVVKGEAHLGFAPTVLYVGSTLDYTNRAGRGTITIKESDEYEDANTEETLAGTYSYVRTGLNTGTLILTELGLSGGVNTIKLTFKKTASGTFTYRFEQGADKERGVGRFGFTAVLPPG
jgi:hypothetical protein